MRILQTKHIPPTVKLGGSISKNPFDRILQAGRLGTAEEEHAERGGGGEGESGTELDRVPA